MPAFMKSGDIKVETVRQMTPSKQHGVRAMLMKNGVSVAGANQFVAGLIVTDPNDRQLLPALLAWSAGRRLPQKGNEKWIEIQGWD